MALLYTTTRLEWFEEQSFRGTKQVLWRRSEIMIKRVSLRLTPYAIHRECSIMVINLWSRWVVGPAVIKARNANYGGHF